MHLACHGVSVIPVHPELPPGPYEHLGYALKFWQFFMAIDAVPEPEMIVRTLCQCHQHLRSFQGTLPEFAILTESMDLLKTVRQRGLFPSATLRLLENHLVSSLAALRGFSCQPLHGDAHPGNLLNTTAGLLWTDWEDTFIGPVE